MYVLLENAIDCILFILLCSDQSRRLIIADSPVFHSPAGDSFGQVATLSTKEAAILNVSVEKHWRWLKGKRGKYNRYYPERLIGAESGASI